MGMMDTSIDFSTDADKKRPIPLYGADGGKLSNNNDLILDILKRLKSILRKKYMKDKECNAEYEELRNLYFDIAKLIKD